ncbi:MAG TPA: O-antigen ligase family protein [Candidatus Bathyarchaeia archaeon]|nr:O-antigen ligase family protein [Candidatus Bathyarchaeia archaeon]
MRKLFGYLEDNILYLSIISLLLFIPLYPKFPLFKVPGTYVAVRLEDFFVALVLGVWFLLEIKHGWPTFKERASRLVLWYFAAGALSLVSALTITRIVVPHLSLLHYLRRLEYMSLFFVTLAALRERKNIDGFWVAIFLATIGVTVFGIGQKFFNWPVISTMNEEFSKGLVLYLSEWTRINSTFAGHYDLAAFSVLVITLCFGFLIGVSSWVLKFLALVLIVLAFYLLLLTASRISFGAYLFSIIIVLLLTKRSKWILPVCFLSLLVMVFNSELGQRYAATFKIDLSFLSPKIGQMERQIVLAPTLTPEPLPVALTSRTPSGPVTSVAPAQKEKVTLDKKKAQKATISAQFPQPESVEIAAQRSGEIRFRVEWPRAIRAFAKNPLLGTGYSSVTLATDNDYLRALAETGLLGFGALSLIFLELTSRLILFIRKPQSVFEKAIVVGLAGGLVGFLINALFIDVFEASKVAFIFWIFAGALLGIIVRLEKLR